MDLASCYKQLDSVFDRAAPSSGDALFKELNSRADELGVFDHICYESVYSRLKWLLTSGLETHRHAAIFLFGSLSWGRFTTDSLQFENSDIDLLVVLKDDEFPLPEHFFNSRDKEIINIAYGKHLDCARDLNADILAFRVCLPGPVHLSFTVFKHRSFLRMWCANRISGLIAVRDTSLPVNQEEVVCPSMGNIILPVTNVSHSDGVWESTSMCLPIDYCEDDVCLSAYQQLIYPKQEYIGPIDTEILILLRSISHRLAKKRFSKDWHYRASRFPSTLTSIGNYFWRGPHQIFRHQRGYVVLGLIL